MSYVLSVIHPPVDGAAFGVSSVLEGVSMRQYAADGAGAALIELGVRTLEAREFANMLARELLGTECMHGGTGLTFRIDDASSPPNVCPCCSRLVKPGDHADAGMEDAYCLGCFTWNRGDVQCLPANTAHPVEEI